MKHTFNCAILNTKQALLQQFAEILEEMYSANYDAWEDAATSLKEDTTWEFQNVDNYENPTLLREILQDITSQNPCIKVLEI